MLFINDEKIDFQEIKGYSGTDPLKRFLKEKMAEIKAGPQQLQFKYREGVIRLNKKEGLPEGKKTVISWDDPVSSSRGSEYWVCATSRTKNPNGTFKYVFPSVRGLVSGKVFVKSLSLDKDRDIDLVLFLLCASSRVRTGLIILENSEAEAMNRLTKSVDKDELKVIVLRMAPEKLRKLGSAFQIENSKSVGEYALREAILGKADIMVSAKNKTYADILAMVKSDETSTMRANVQVAKDMGILAYQNGVYGFANEKGNVITAILTIPTKREFEKDEVLIAFLEQNNEVYTKLVQEIKGVEESDKATSPSSESGKAKTEGPVEVSAEEKTEIIDGITTYVVANGKLPFDATDKDKIKQIIKILGIEGYQVGKRTYATIYDDVKTHFGL